MKRLEDAVHPEDWSLVRGAIERAGSAGERINVEYRILAREGGVRWVSSRGRVRLTSSGEPQGVMGVSIDISERKRSEEALRASEARLASGAELAGLAFYEVDFGAGTMYSDDRLRDLCGVPPDRVAGLGVLEFWMEHVHPDDRPRVMELRRQMHEGEQERFSVEYRYVHPDGDERWIQHLAGAATRDAGGHAVRTYGVLRDVTDRKRAEEESRDLSRRLIRAQEEERALLARELHDDVSQRLAVLAIDVGRAELAAADGEQADAMQAVREGLVSLSEDIHSLAYQLHPSVLEELGLVEALRAECGRRTRGGGLDVSVDLGPPPRALTKDSALCLFRVAQEALSNVAHHAGACRATVTLRQIGDGLLLAVSDDGVGFEPEHSGEGMHLGLASMRERVRLVRGTLDIESAPGQGTKVIAWVPVQGGGIRMTSAHRPRVLLADDHLMVAEALTSLLSPEFDLVGVVEDGRQLIEAAGTLRPDVIVADITMPHLNGIDALIRLREEGNRVPVVFLTMHKDVTFARRALEAGASGFVLKHSASVELVAALHAALEGKTYLTPQLAGEVLEAMKQGPSQDSDPAASLTLRQREVLQLLAEGRSAKEIAASLSISTRTVEFHKYQMMETLGLRTNAELIHFAIKNGLVEF